MLTPLEVKEISNEATADVLFEASKKRSASTNKDRKRQKTKKSEPQPDDQVSILHYMIKSLTKGTQLLVKVILVSTVDITVAVGNQIVASIPITSVSEELTQMLEDAEASDDSSEESEDDDDDESAMNSTNITKAARPHPPRLTKLFTQGQYLRAIVADNEHKRISLSIEPSAVNAGVESEDLQVGAHLQVAVRSIEDNGVVLSTGVAGTTAFMPKRVASKLALVPGGVILATIVSKKGRTITMEPIHKNLNSSKEDVETISSVDAIKPGAMVDCVVSDVTDDGIATRVYGLIDGTLTHPAIGNTPKKIGSRVAARVLGVVVREGAKRLVLSRAPHVLTLDESDERRDEFPLGRVVDATVVARDSAYVYFDVGSKTTGHVHRLQLRSDYTFDVHYAVGTSHRARVCGYNPMDRLVLLTVKEEDLEREYLTSAEVPVGTVVKDCEVVRFTEKGDMILKAYSDFDAFVPARHISDIKLSHPELKYKVGSKVTARVLAHANRRLEVTLKRSLVQAEHVISDISDVHAGVELRATVDALVRGGALVLFFGHVRAFLPKSEILEAFVANVTDVLRVGQTVDVRVLEVREEDRIIVSARHENAGVAPVDLIDGRSVFSAEVISKQSADVTVQLAPGVFGVLRDGHLADGTYEQCRLRLKKLAVGSKIEVVVLEHKSRATIVSAKKSLVAAAKTGGLPLDYSELSVQSAYTGYVRSITNMGLFVTFGGRLTGLALAKNTGATDLLKSFFKDQTVHCRVIRTDDDQRRFLLAVEQDDSSDLSQTALVNPVDTTKSHVGDFVPGTITKARATSAGVILADNLRGYIDASQKDGELEGVVDVKVIGYRNSKTYEFSPRANTTFGDATLIELSALESELRSPNEPYLPFDVSSVQVGSTVESYVRNAHNGHLITSFSPAVIGKISFNELGSVDGSLFDAFPVGSKITATVKAVDNNTITLKIADAHVTSISDLEVGQSYPSKVFTVKDNLVLVELGPGVVGCAYITDALDDVSKTLPETFSKNDFARATVLDVEQDSGRVAVSIRKPDARIISSISDLVRGEKITGFVKKISNIGVHVALGRTVHALVRASDLFDKPVSDWKKHFKMSQPVEGRILECAEEHRVLMTLKESEVRGDHALLKVFKDLVVGDVFEGSVKNVQEFGVFVKLDGTANLSGLCHRSEIADTEVSDVAALFSEGDRVKVKVLNLDPAKHKMSLGMKATYFGDEHVDDEHVNDDEDHMDVDHESDDHESDDNESDDHESDEESESTPAGGLSAGALSASFDWTASILDQAEESESEDEEDFTVKKKKKTKARTEDKTADLSTRAPQSVGDFERLLVGNPNSSVLWMNYMSFQLQLSEIDKAREIGERALKTIGYREEQEKMNIWIAMLNLENTFGSDETLAEVFQRSCQYMDALTMHQKLVGIYQMSEKFDAAEELFQSMIKRFSKEVPVWVSYGSMLLDRKKTQETHEVLARALQALPKRDHIEVVRKFAQLEFAKGEPEQGRSLFEGLIADAPKRIDLWNVYIDQEMKVADKSVIEGLFERVVQKKLLRKQAKFFFAKWLAFEEDKGDDAMAARVKAKAMDYVKEEK